MLPKLVRMSLRTMPVSASAFDTVPLIVLEPSAGNGPSVSSALTTQVPLLVDEPLELEDPLELDELLESLVESLPPPPQPQAVSSVVAARPAAPSRTRRRPRVSRSWARPLS